MEKRIGSTIPSLIAQTSPYGGLWSAYNYITSAVPNKDNVMLQVGREVEGYVTRAGIKAIHPEWLVLLGMDRQFIETFQIKDTPSVFAEIDGVPYRDTPDGKVVASHRHRKPIFLIEAKRCQYSDRDEWMDPLPLLSPPDEGQEVPESKIPQVYYDQCQHHMMLHPGVSAVLLPVIFNWTDTPRTYIVRRNEARISELHEMNKSFWNTYIIPEITPPADASDAMKEYLKHQAATEELYIEAEEEDYVHMYNLLSAKEHLVKIKAVIQERENVLKERIGSNFGLTFFDNGRITYKPNKKGTRTLNYKTVKKEKLGS